MNVHGRHGVIFDMDGVLVDSYRPHFESWRRLAAELGRDLTEEAFAATFGQTSREIIRQLFDVTDPALIARCDVRKEAIYRDLIRARVPAMPGAVDLVERLHAAGFRLAVGSSGPRENVELVCDAMNLARWMSAVVTGADVTRGKPDPEVFLLAARRLGLPPAACLVIEDAPAGLAAARAAGMPCVGLASSPHATALDADLILSRLEDLSLSAVSRLLSIDGPGNRHGEAQPA